MAQYSTWQNFWWLNVAMHGTVFLMVLFGFPETKWHRLHPDEMRGVSSISSSNERVAIDTPEDFEKGRSSREMPDLSHAATAEKDPYLGRGTPSKQQFKLYQPNAHPLKTILVDLWTPWKLFAFPIVEFASFVVSWAASSFLTINLTQSQAFAAPPYLFSATSIGFMNFAILTGQLIGLLTAGPLSDWISMRATKRNNGIREPEMRLPTMVPYVLIMILGNFIVAFGFEHHWDWKVGHCPYTTVLCTLTDLRLSSSSAGLALVSKSPLSLLSSAPMRM